MTGKEIIDFIQKNHLEDYTVQFICDENAEPDWSEVKKIALVKLLDCSDLKDASLIENEIKEMMPNVP